MKIFGEAIILLVFLICLLVLAGCKGTAVIVTEGEGNGLYKAFGGSARIIKITIRESPPVSVKVLCKPQEKCLVDVTPYHD